LATHKKIYFLSFGVLIGQTIIPVWLFQGMEKMKFITIINLVVRTSAVVLIFILVKTPEDVNLGIAAQAISFTVAGILSLVLAYREFKIKFVIPKFSQIRALLIESRHMFFSTLLLSLYKNFNVVLLGFLSSTVEVGLYAAAERIIKAVQSLIAPMAQAIYPNLSLKFSKLTIKQSVMDLKRIGTYYLLPLFVIMLSLVLFKGVVAQILDMTEYDGFTWVYYALIPVILFGSLNYLLGIVGLVNLNKEKWFQRATIAGSLVNFTLCLIFATKYGDIASAIALSTAEFIVLIIVIRYLYKLSKFPN
jgi:PST family polysaccharide transporter